MYMYTVCVVCGRSILRLSSVQRFSDPPMRESVDFGELLESEEDREENRQRKYVIVATRIACLVLYMYM